MLKGNEPMSRRDVLAYSLDSNWEVMTVEFATAPTIDLKPGACVDANGALVVTGSTVCYVIADGCEAGSKYAVVFDRLCALKKESLYATDKTKALQLIKAADKIRLV